MNNVRLWVDGYPATSAVEIEVRFRTFGDMVASRV
jgi:hypothetical protein